MTAPPNPIPHHHSVVSAAENSTPWCAWRLRQSACGLLASLLLLNSGCFPRGDTSLDAPSRQEEPAAEPGAGPTPIEERPDLGSTASDVSSGRVSRVSGDNGDSGGSGGNEDNELDAPFPSGPLDETQQELRAAAVRDLCSRIGSKLSSVSEEECNKRGLQPSGVESVLGAPIVTVDHGAANSGAGRVLLLGGIHGDEYSSVTISFKWLTMLESEVDRRFRWRVLPLLNPDGLLRNSSQRMNHRGVDLNRNFPTPNWEAETKDYWVRRTSRNPRRYPGPAALSEPESRFLYEQIKSFQPDLIIAVHAPLEVVDFDGPAAPPEKLGPLYLQRMGTYPGSLGRYGSEELGLPVVTIELPSAGTMPSRSEQRRIWSDLNAYIERTLGDEAKPATGAS